jgi:large conductance mechanosensitive channel
VPSSPRSPAHEERPCRVPRVRPPLIAAIGGQPDFSDLHFTINESQFNYGAFINALLSFIVIAAVIFFLVVKPVNALLARNRSDDEPAPESPTPDVMLLAEIRDLLRTRA